MIHANVRPTVANPSKFHTNHYTHVLIVLVDTYEINSKYTTGLGTTSARPLLDFCLSCNCTSTHGM